VHPAVAPDAHGATNSAAADAFAKVPGEEHVEMEGLTRPTNATDGSLSVIARAAVRKPGASARGRPDELKAAADASHAASPRKGGAVCTLSQRVRCSAHTARVNSVRAAALEHSLGHPDIRRGRSPAHRLVGAGGAAGRDPPTTRR
jgi:hypothetical protein